MARKFQTTGPASIPAIVKGRDGREERCVYLTSPQKPNSAIILPKDSKPAREVGASPVTGKTAGRRIHWA
jgi:hypothetical protein